MPTAIAVKSWVLHGMAVVALGVLLIAAPQGADAQPVDFLTAQDRVLKSNLSGNFQEALQWAERALAIAEREAGPQSTNAASAHLSIAIQHQSLGRLEIAETHYRKGLAIQEKLVPVEDLSLAPFATGLGGLLHGQGRYDAAEPYMRKALLLQESYAARSGNVTGLAVALFMLGSNYTYMSRLDEGLRLLERSLATFGQFLPEGGVQTAIVLNNLATNRQLAGNYAAAVTFQQHALQLFMKFSPQNLPGIAKVNNNLGYLHQQSGNIEKATEHYRLAIDQLKKAFPNGHADIATASMNFGGLLATLGRLGEAQGLLVSALEMRRRWLPADHIDIALAHSELADLYVRRGDFQRARDELRTAAKILTARAARQEGGRGSVTRNDILQNPLTFAKLLKIEHRSTPVDANAAFIVAQHVIGSSAAASLAQMAARGAEGDARLSALVRSRQDLVAAWHGLDKELVAALSATTPDPAALNVLRGRVADADKRVSAIDAEISAAFPKFTALANPAPLSLAEVGADLEEGEALILVVDTPAHLVMPEETFIFVVSRDKHLWLRSKLGTSAIAREVAALRCGLDFAGAWQSQGSQCASLTGTTYSAEDEAAGRPLPFDPARAHQLYSALFGEAASLVAGKNLLVVTSGALSQLPLHVLVTKAPTRGGTPGPASIAFMARSYALSVLPAVSSLRALRRDARPSAATEPFVGFGNPKLDGQCGAVAITGTCAGEQRVAGLDVARSHNRSIGLPAGAARYFRDGRADISALRQLCALPDTEHEVRCVARSLGASDDAIRLGGAMREAELKGMRLHRYRILHFATHGLLAGEMAKLSAEKAEPALVMTPPDTPSEIDDGLLTASEIAALKLDADWVIMSACNTAAGSSPNAEALSGLARAFFYAGARALLVSHWPVNSYAATVLTTRTFTELRQQPRIGRSEALRRAMMSLMDTGPAWMAHPSVWAPFVVVGEGGAPLK